MIIWRREALMTISSNLSYSSPTSTFFCLGGRVTKDSVSARVLCYSVYPLLAYGLRYRRVVPSKIGRCQTLVDKSERACQGPSLRRFGAGVHGPSVIQFQVTNRERRVLFRRLGTVDGLENRYYFLYRDLVLYLILLY